MHTLIKLALVGVGMLSLAGCGEVAASTQVSRATTVTQTVTSTPEATPTPTAAPCPSGFHNGKVGDTYSGCYADPTPTPVPAPPPCFVEVDATNGIAQIHLLNVTPDFTCSEFAQTMTALTGTNVNLISSVTLPHLCHAYHGPAGNGFSMDVYAHPGNPHVSTLC